MKKLLSLTLFLVFSTIIFAQKTITGSVKNDVGKPIASASVTVEEIGKNAILAYSITDAKGNYSVTFTSNDAKVLVKVKAFNHKTQTAEYSNASQTLHFKLNEQATEIKEVKLKTKLITKRGDTISYDLKSFESKADRTLADVLKKIPGIEVNKDGSILYQGEPINKFYVEGKDLMEGSYGIINNALPKDAVQKVEVMENHQPVKILQDKVSSENAAINIKLKKSVTMTGRGEVSSGFAEPWLWNVKLTPMLFTPKYQWALNYKTNNVGEEVEKENNILAFGNRFEGVRRNFSDGSWLNVEKASTPNDISIKRYLLNNVHYLSANVLTNLSKEWEFKANTSYSNNSIERESQRQTYIGNQTNINFVKNNFYTNQAKGELIFTKNAKKGFFKNTTTYNGLWNTDYANALNNNVYATQKNTAPSSNFQNSLSTIIPVKEKLINVMSFLSYRNDRQDLTINPTNYVAALASTITNSPEVHQALNLKTFEANHSASVGFSKKNWTFTPELGFNYTSNNLETDLYGQNNTVRENLASNYQNQLNFKNTNLYTQMMINFKKEGLDINLTAPVNFYNISAIDKARNLDKNLIKTTVEPRLFVRYDLTSFWKISGFTGMNYNFGGVNDIFGGYILFSAQNLYSKNTEISQSFSRYAGSKLEYRNPLNNIFFNASYNYSLRTSNIIYNTNVINANQFEIQGIMRDNDADTNAIRTEIGKYFPKFKSNLSFNYNVSLGKSQQLVNNNLSDFNTQNQSFGLKFNNTYFSWVSVDYNANWNWRTATNQQTTKTNSWNHNLSTYFYPKENHTIGFTWDHFYSKLTNNTFNNAFYDVSYQYTIAKKKIDLEFKIMNIANTKSFENISVNNLNWIIHNSTYIRPRQAMITVKFNFK